MTTPSSPTATVPPTHAHRCMRCGREFVCQTPNLCAAKYDVLPSIVRVVAGQVEITDHCEQDASGAWVPRPEFPVPTATVPPHEHEFDTELPSIDGYRYVGCDCGATRMLSEAATVPREPEPPTFEELLAHGLAVGGKPVVNGMPWSFDYHGMPVTHESDDCYLLLTPKGSVRVERNHRPPADKITVVAHERDLPAASAGAGAEGTTPEWWCDARPETVDAACGRLLAFVNKHAAKTLDNLPRLRDVHQLMAAVEELRTRLATAEERLAVYKLEPNDVRAANDRLRANNNALNVRATQAESRLATAERALAEAREDADKWRASQARRFPIQDGPDIPWSSIAPFEKQAQRNHSQSLERLAARGGLGVFEALAVLKDIRLFGPEWDALVKHPKPLAIRHLLELTQPATTPPTEERPT